MKKVQHWICEVCKKVLTTYVPLREAPKCSDVTKHSKTIEMKPTKTKEK